MIAKFISKEIQCNRIKVGRNGHKGRNISPSSCRKWNQRLKMVALISYHAFPAGGIHRVMFTNL
jgi:hypothetical protein